MRPDTALIAVRHRARHLLGQVHEQRTAAADIEQVHADAEAEHRHAAGREHRFRVPDVEPQVGPGRLAGRDVIDVQTDERAGLLSHATPFLRGVAGAFHPTRGGSRRDYRQRAVAAQERLRGAWIGRVARDVVE